MTDIRKNDDICTQITTVKLPPDNQQEALDLMIERARFMTSQPGFVSINLHRSKDGSHLINYNRRAAGHPMETVLQPGVLPHPPQHPLTFNGQTRA
jgi:hypothetical protein